MIHYTPLSDYDIIEDDAMSYEKHMTMTVNGKMCRVEQLDDGSYQLVQLLSTDPQDYLDQQYVPGTILTNGLLS
ncbi:MULTISPECIES: YlzJ-like family protein [Pontibacillus]|uniref:YlzJ-like family protein n=1 Tax=Pontibacillus chungwhensis TaxID=265426 RepID=A0ABY8V635_9BACI|nr:MULTISPECIES: YlzJ-like family protein [Pontibacillus]MCD5322742.1 YlzJ-like family protein [Pontibacillus sp. HN14]WIG00016.1 YlzJ-like family protein [Pontibacillus chungwhensis]